MEREQIMLKHRRMEQLENWLAGGIVLFATVIAGPKMFEKYFPSQYDNVIAAKEQVYNSVSDFFSSYSSNDDGITSIDSLTNTAPVGSGVAVVNSGVAPVNSAAYVASKSLDGITSVDSSYYNLERVDSE